MPSLSVVHTTERQCVCVDVGQRTAHALVCSTVSHVHPLTSCCCMRAQALSPEEVAPSQTSGKFTLINIYRENIFIVAVVTGDSALPPLPPLPLSPRCPCHPHSPTPYSPTRCHVTPYLIPPSSAHLPMTPHPPIPPCASLPPASNCTVLWCAPSHAIGRQRHKSRVLPSPFNRPSNHSLTCSLRCTHGRGCIVCL